MTRSRVTASRATVGIRAVDESVRIVVVAVAAVAPALLGLRGRTGADDPSLELSLTDMQDQAIARRVFHPADYLKPGTDEKLGAPANRDLDIRLRMDTTDLKPSGYPLFVFSPY